MHQTNLCKKQEETGRGAAYLDGGDRRGGTEVGRPGQGLDGVAGGQGDVVVGQKEAKGDNATKKSRQLGHKKLPKAKPVHAHARAAS